MHFDEKSIEKKTKSIPQYTLQKIPYVMFVNLMSRGEFNQEYVHSMCLKAVHTAQNIIFSNAPLKGSTNIMYARVILMTTFRVGGYNKKNI